MTINQRTWYINADTGSDSNPGGTPQMALKTFAGLMAKWEGEDLAEEDYDVYIMTDLDEDDVIRYEGFTVSPTTWGINFYGTETTVHTGTISAVTEFNDSTRAYGEIEDDSIQVSWTAEGCTAGKRIELTSGDNEGAIAFIHADLGSKKIRHSPFFDPIGWEMVHPAVDDTYEVVTLPKLNQWMIMRLQTSCLSYFYDLDFNGEGITTHEQNYNDLANYGTRIFIGCSFTYEGSATTETHVSNGPAVILFGCFVSSTKFQVGWNSQMYLGCVGFHVRPQPRVYPGGEMFISLPCFHYKPDGGKLMTIHVRGGKLYIREDSWWGIEDPVSNYCRAISVATGGMVQNEGCVWGSGFGTLAPASCMEIYVGGKVYYTEPTTSISERWNVVGTGAFEDIVLAGTNKDYADLPEYDASADACIIEFKGMVF
jgi:hypothetical protein